MEYRFHHTFRTYFNRSTGNYRVSLIGIHIMELHIRVNVEVVAIHPRNEGHAVLTQRRMTPAHFDSFLHPSDVLQSISGESLH